MSDSDAYGGQPRSVPDPDGDAYDEMIWRNKMLGDRNFTQADSEPSFPDVGHPGTLESMIPIWGSGREALADLHDGNYAGAAVNGALAASDVVLAKAVAGGLLKGGLKLGESLRGGARLGRSKGMRGWLGDRGFLKPGQPGHHWWLEQKSSIPDWIKNQPPFVKGMTDAVEHGRVHGPYTVGGVKLPQFNAAQRAWFGTPDWFKALNVSIPGHAGAAAGSALNEQD